MSDECIRVLVVDDHAVVREGIRALLETEEGIEVVGEAEDGRQGVAKAVELRPDVILMDLVMPEVDGTKAIREILARFPEAKILVLTSFGGDDRLFPAVRAGALGYLIKDAEPRELIRAVQEAARGYSSLDPTVARRLLREINREPGSPPSLNLLSEREEEVLRALALGLSNVQIGRKLHISNATVRTHVSHILAKLNLANRTQAVLYALRAGIAPLEGPEEP